jgi:hypothetical protein
MPAWGKMLNEHQIWQLTTFMSHMDKLPPGVAAAWKTAANVSEAGASSDSGSQTQPKEKKSTNMPMH